jgi:hypothetical protein
MRKAMTTDNTTHSTWYQQPVVWLGALIFIASLAGCVWMIVLGARYADEPVATNGATVFKVPTNQPAAAQDPPEVPQ